MATVVADADEAVSGIADGSTVLIGGFGPAGQPVELVDALIRSGVERSHGGEQQCRQRPGRTGRPARERPGPQDHLFVPPASRLLRLR